MADTKISNLTELTSPAVNDELVIVDTDTGETKRISHDNLFGAVDEIRARSASGLKLYEDGGSGIFVGDGGNVGIGTTNPDQKLEVYDGILKLSQPTASNNILRFEEDGSTSYNIGSDGTDLHIAGSSFSSDKYVTIDSSGSIGIGTTGPGSKLEVAGDIELSGTAFRIIKHDQNNQGIHIVGGNSISNGGRITLTGSNIGTNPSEIQFISDGSEKVRIDSSGNVGIGDADPDFKLEIAGTLGLQEVADAIADEAGTGQIWVHDTTPNELWFTDDAGTDTQISPHPLDAPSGLYKKGPGIDMIDKRVQKYLGVIFWTPNGGGTVEETFEEYNTRRKNVLGHRDLVKKDWSVERKRMRDKWKQDWIKQNKTEIEVGKEEALEQGTKTEMTEEIDYYEKVHRYKLNEDGEVDVEEKQKPIYKTREVPVMRLKAEHRFDETTGKFYKTYTPTDEEAEITAVENEDNWQLPTWIMERLNASNKEKI